MAESHEQKTIVAWWRLQHRQDEKAIRASQSGGFKGRGRAGAIRMSEMKAMGVVTGESDLAFLIPKGQYGSLIIELKRTGDKRGAREDQDAYLKYHNSIGNLALLATGVDEAISFIKSYMALARGELWEPA
jgi:hypothetical protein